MTVPDPSYLQRPLVLLPLPGLLALALPGLALPGRPIIGIWAAKLLTELLTKELLKERGDFRIILGPCLRPMDYFGCGDVNDVG